MKRKTHKTYDKLAIVGLIFNMIGALLLLWVVASFINVIAHNTTDYNYWSFNIFILLFG